MPVETKVREVEGFSQVLKDSSSVVLTDFTGLDVAAISELRRKCREAGVHYRVIKNTLARRAVSEAGMQELDPLLEGPNAWAVHPTDQIVTAKVLSEFAKENTSLKIRGGFMDGHLVSVTDIQTLAKLPSREVLLSQTLMVLQAPMVGFAGVLTALLRGFACVLDGYTKKRADTDTTASAAAPEPEEETATAKEPESSTSAEDTTTQNEADKES